jgi:hypothetical protein
LELSKPENLFLDELVDDLKPQRFWHPSLRSAAWFVGFTLLSAAGMLYRQAFREGFLDQLLEHSRFAAEVLSSGLFIYFLLSMAFTKMVPGRTISLKTWLWWLLSLVTWAFTLYWAFDHASPEASFAGARFHCYYETVIHGVVGVTLLIYFVRKSHFPMSYAQYLSLGLTAGLIPGLLMQMACMYTPLHGIKYHYAPALFVLIPALLILPLFKKRS